MKTLKKILVVYLVELFAKDYKETILYDITGWEDKVWNCLILSGAIRSSGTERPRLFRFCVRTLAFSWSLSMMSSVIPACSIGCTATPPASAAIAWKPFLFYNL